MKILRDFITNSSSTNFVIVANDSRIFDTIRQQMIDCEDGNGETEVNFIARTYQELEDSILEYASDDEGEQYPDIESLVFDQGWGYEFYYDRHKKHHDNGHITMNADISYHNASTKELLEDLKDSGAIVDYNEEHPWKLEQIL